MVTVSTSSHQAKGTMVALVRVALLLLAAALFLVAARLPWWGMLLHAPQYPQGLELVAYLHGMAGDVEEFGVLNHYIGMMSFADAAQVERGLVPYAVPVMALLVAASAFLRGRWARWARVPMMTFPVLFMIDLAFWMWHAGNNLDPAAPLSQTVQAFTPTLLGSGRIAQFVTYGYLEPGFWLAILASILALSVGLLLENPPPAGDAP